MKRDQDFYEGLPTSAAGPEDSALLELPATPKPVPPCFRLAAAERSASLASVLVAWRAGGCAGQGPRDSDVGGRCESAAEWQATASVRPTGLRGVPRHRQGPAVVEPRCAG
ncbi:hypothetical protein Ddc_22136 [Ditylenchus destructor]|nr:hypothetical protein Ddc_22136 [Ditylenchus destructor]